MISDILVGNANIASLFRLTLMYRPSGLGKKCISFGLRAVKVPSMTPAVACYRWELCDDRDFHPGNCKL